MCWFESGVDHHQTQTKGNRLLAMLPEKEIISKTYVGFGHSSGCPFIFMKKNQATSWFISAIIFILLSSITIQSEMIAFVAVAVICFICALLCHFSGK
jgi:hypothetical protein